jgi:hypothetical protein
MTLYRVPSVAKAEMNPSMRTTSYLLLLTKEESDCGVERRSPRSG